jgi:hypothetical protein
MQRLGQQKLSQKEKHVMENLRRKPELIGQTRSQRRDEMGSHARVERLAITNKAPCTEEVRRCVGSEGV